MNESPIILEAKEIARRVAAGSERFLLEDVSLRLPAGGRFALSGPPGSGKTLLLRALACLDPIDQGAVWWNGSLIAPAQVPLFRRHVVYLHQQPALGEGTVESCLRLPYTLSVHSHSRFDRDNVLRLLKLVDRDATFLARQNQDLSGGEQQMVAFIRALQLAPTVLLLDEPTASLNDEATAAIETCVQVWQQADDQRATIWASHDANQRQRVADVQLAMNQGRLT